MATAIKQDIAGETQRMGEVLAAQKASFTAAMPESLAVRTDRIDRAIGDEQNIPKRVKNFGISRGQGRGFVQKL
mgnify:CR=1 FL=1